MFKVGNGNIKTIWDFCGSYQNVERLAERLQNVALVSLLLTFTLLPDFTYHSDVSIVDFEQVNTAWAASQFWQKINTISWKSDNSNENVTEV